MNKVIREIIFAPNELALKELLMAYHKSNLVFQSSEQNRSEYLLLIELINQEYERYDNKLKSGIESISFWLGAEELQVSKILSNLDYSKQFFSNISKVERSSIVLDELPDYLTDADLSRIFGWELSTISSKRSRGELPQVNGLKLTPKSELVKMLESKTIDVVDTSQMRKDAVSETIDSFRRKKKN